MMGTTNEEDGVNYTGKVGVMPSKTVKKEDRLDINKDGQFDAKDVSLAGKILQKTKHKKVN